MKKLLPVLILLVMALIGLGGGIFGGMYMQAQKEAALKKPEPEVAKPPILYDMPEMLVGLAAGDGKGHVLRIALTLQFKTDEDLSAAKEYGPRMLDAVQIYLRERTPSDLRGKAGIEKLRKELPEVIDTVIAPGHVAGVLIRTMGITDV